jgi:hypothetical protein
MKAGLLLNCCAIDARLLILEMSGSVTEIL